MTNEMANKLRIVSVVEITPNSQRVENFLTYTDYVKCLSNAKEYFKKLLEENMCSNIDEAMNDDFYETLDYYVYLCQTNNRFIA